MPHKKIKMKHFKLDCPVCGKFLNTEIMRHSFRYIDNEWQFIHYDCEEILNEFDKS
jgi:C4-type Zn-finger protein